MPLVLENLLNLTDAEIETAVQENVPSGLSLVFEPSDRYLTAIVSDNQGNPTWSRSSSDPRILLFDVVGYFLYLQGHQPRHPAWRRRGEVAISSAVGNKAHQAYTPIPDPEDLNPNEILSVYGLRPKDQKK